MFGSFSLTSRDYLPRKMGPYDNRIRGGYCRGAAASTLCLKPLAVLLSKNEAKNPACERRRSRTSDRQRRHARSGPIIFASKLVDDAWRCKEFLCVVIHRTTLLSVSMREGPRHHCKAAAGSCTDKNNNLNFSTLTTVTFPFFQFFFSFCFAAHSPGFVFN